MVCVVPASASALPRILLPLLLCLSLIATALGSAWASAAMAMPVAGSAAQHDCPDTPSSLHDADQPAPDQPLAACGDGKHCQCTQHGTLLPLALPPLLADLPRAAAPPPAHAGLAKRAPGRLIRPPIA